MSVNMETMFRSKYTTCRSMLKVLLETVHAMSSDDLLAEDQCLVMFIISRAKLQAGPGGSTEHGYGKIDHLYGSDDVAVYPQDILEPLTDEKCVQLRGKPKLIFFTVAGQLTLLNTLTWLQVVKHKLLLFLFTLCKSRLMFELISCSN